MNLLTFDIEEWYLEYLNGGNTEKYNEFDRYLEAILVKLEEHKLKATFFCVGEMGRLFPKIIQKIHVAGHEIGCHSNVHAWLNKMTLEECRYDTHCAVESLEQCIGKKVKSYRAPAFSIGKSNLWAFDILAENGIERDASVFPAKRDFGGFEEFGEDKPCIIRRNGISIKEFPICTFKILGKKFAYSGGGYFRLLPLYLIKNEMMKHDYNMCYFHIGDLIPEDQRIMTKEEYESYFKESGTLKARSIRYIKTNLGKKKAFIKLNKIIDCTLFVNLIQADNMIDWSSTQVRNI